MFMDRIKLLRQKFLLVLLFFFPLSAFAIGGLYDYGFSEIPRGMGGATAALPQDSVIAAVNPAGVAFLEPRTDTGIEIILPDASYFATARGTPVSVSPGNHNSGVTMFALPDGGLNMRLTPRDNFDISLYSIAGFGASYAPVGSALVASGLAPGILGDGRASTDLKDVALNFALAHRFGEHTAFGASFIVIGQEFQGRGLNQFAGVSVGGANANLNRGSDYNYGLGARIGFLTRILPKLDFGLSYQPIIHIQPMALYQNLFAQGGRAELPPVGIIGIAYHILDSLVLALDVEEIWYKATPAYGNNDFGLASGACAAGNTQTCLGGLNGAGFGWQNQTSVKLGVQWKYNDKWTYRIGWNHGNQIAPANQVVENILLPGGVLHDIITVGLSHVMNKNNQLNLVVNWVPMQSLTGPNSLASNSQTITLHTGGVGFALGWSYLF